jgi:signal transduction histidine kinase
MLGRLESAFEGLQRFTADAAHELRAPLALMRTQVDVILRKPRTQEQYQSSHRTLLEEIERLSRMADQLLLLARADAGALAPHRETVEVRELLEEVIERWRPAAREHAIAIRADLPGEGTTRADPDLLRRLFDNLLDNALRHTPAGGEVRVVAAPEAHGWRFEVQDTGAGIDPDLRHRLFERFTRADPARGRDSGGAGLGLSLCAAIARAHGGSITLQDPANHTGARFVVRFPTEGSA